MTPLALTDWLAGLWPTIIFFLMWLIPVLIAFARLQKQALDESAKAVWVLIILILPIVGPITYLMLNSRHGTGKQ